MKITFINLKPNIKSDHPRHTLPPLDIGYCASLLEKKGNKTYLVDQNIWGYTINQLRDSIIKNKSDILIVKPGINNVKYTLELSNKTKDIVKKIFLIGPFASLYYKDFIFKESPIDLVVLNEPELTLLELSENYGKDKELRNIEGVVYYDKKIIITRQRKLIKKLDILPFPKHEFFIRKGYTFYYPVNIRKKTNTGYILSSRGCPHKCIFCSTIERVSYGRLYRTRCPKNIVDEMIMLKDQGINVIYFIDDNFTENRHHVIDVCDEIIRRKLDIKWVAQSRISDLDRIMLTRMKKAGCSTLSLGIESGSNRILRILQKNITTSKIRQAFKLIKKQKLLVNANFILGNPTETEAELKQTLNLAKILMPEMVTFSFYTVYDPKNFNNRFINTSRFDVKNNPSKLTGRELKSFQKKFYIKYYMNMRFILNFMLKQGIYTILNLRKLIAITLKFFLIVLDDKTPNE
ncbi:MAG: radical SAM protein [Nanoarchaeota archaeon]